VKFSYLSATVTVKCYKRYRTFSACYQKLATVVFGCNEA